MHMHLRALLFTLILAVACSSTAGAQASSPADTPASDKGSNQTAGRKDGNPSDTAPANLPVSLDRIREGLEQTPRVTLRGLDQLAPKQEAQFRVEIEERRKIDDLLATLNFKSGPVPRTCFP